MANSEVKKTPKTVIAMMSSKLEAAMSLVGIPFFTPYPFSYNNMQEGTRTAGLTAAKTKPVDKQSITGSLKTSQQKKATAMASEI